MIFDFLLVVGSAIELRLLNSFSGCKLQFCACEYCFWRTWGLSANLLIDPIPSVKMLPKRVFESSAFQNVLLLTAALIWLRWCSRQDVFWSYQSAQNGLREAILLFRHFRHLSWIISAAFEQQALFRARDGRNTFPISLLDRSLLWKFLFDRLREKNYLFISPWWTFISFGIFTSVSDVREKGSRSAHKYFPG